MLHTLIEQYQVYLQLQHRISQAIYNQDERLLMHLKQASQELFHQIEDQRESLVKTGKFKDPHQSSGQVNLSQLIQVMEDAQQQVQKNERGLQIWLDQMKSDVQHHRKVQTPRGVLATYMQQRQDSSSLTTNVDNAIKPSEPEPPAVDPVPPTPASPWMIPGNALDTMGHQVNHQS